MSNVEDHFMCLLAICMSSLTSLVAQMVKCLPTVGETWVYSLEKCLFRSSYFLIEWFVFLVLSYMSCLHILEINPLSVVSIAIIFSHSEGCLFSLLIVSFAVQKLFSLIRSHLFTYVFISITLGGGS